MFVSPGLNLLTAHVQMRIDHM